jgi:hypothetical protein
MTRRIVRHDETIGGLLLSGTGTEILKLKKRTLGLGGNAVKKPLRFGPTDFSSKKYTRLLFSEQR